VHGHAVELGHRLFATLGSYIQAQTLVSLIDAVFIGLGLFFVGVPCALVLAIIVFVTGYLPVIGAFVSGLLAVLVALASEGLLPAVIVSGIVVLVQQLEGNVLAPWLLGKSMQLHGAPPPITDVGLEPQIASWQTECRIVTGVRAFPIPEPFLPRSFTLAGTTFFAWRTASTHRGPAPSRRCSPGVTRCCTSWYSG